MIECIVNTLIKKFDVNRGDAIIFYYELKDRRKLEHFISHFEEFKTFKQLQNYYLGGH